MQTETKETASDERISQLIQDLASPPIICECASSEKLETGHYVSVSIPHGDYGRTEDSEEWVSDGTAGGFGTELYEDRRKIDEAFNELLKIGKPVVPYLLRVFSSDYGEFPERCCAPFAAPSCLLSRLEDEKFSSTLLKPFDSRLKKLENMRRRDTPSGDCLENRAMDHYLDQLSSIAVFWAEYPIPYVAHPLKNALREATQNGEFPYEPRIEFIKALCSVGTRFAVDAALGAEADCYNFGWNRDNQPPLLKCAMVELKKRRWRTGNRVYDVLRSTKCPGLKEAASKVLGWALPLFAFRRLIGLDKHVHDEA